MPNPYDSLRRQVQQGIGLPVRDDPIPTIQAGEHRGERPNAFVRLRVLLFVALVIAVLVATAIGERGVAGRVADHRVPGPRHDEALLADMAASEPDDEANALLYVATKGAGVHRYQPKSTFWDRLPPDRLLTDNVVGIEIEGGLITYVCQQGADGPRGIVFSNAARELKDMVFWKKPFLGLSSFPAATDQSVACAEWLPGGDSPGLVLVGTERGGIGRYCPATRHWLDPIVFDPPVAVRDILRDPSTGACLVATSAGIAILPAAGAVAVKPPDPKAFADRTLTAKKGLLSDDIRRLARRGSEVWYITMAGGLGRFTLGANGTAGGFVTLVGEGGLPELDLPNIKFVSVDQPNKRIWVAYDRKDQGNIGLYRHDTHDWIGLADRSLPNTEILWFQADLFRQAGAGAVLLVGSRRGVSSVREATDGRSLVLGNHGPDEAAHEVHSTPGAVWAHLEKAEGAAKQVRLALVERAKADPADTKPWTWTRNFFGPLTYPGLKDASFLSALRWKDRTLVGTRGLGIGEYHPDSREFVRLWGQRAGPGDRGLRHDTALALVPWGDERVGIVTGDEALDVLAVADGQVTQVLRPEGLTADPSQLTGAAAQRDTLLLAGSKALVRYSQRDHAWQSLVQEPELTDPNGQLELFFGAGQLWAAAAGKLYQGTFQDNKVLWRDAGRTIRHRRHWQDESALVILDAEGAVHAYSKAQGQWLPIVAPTRWTDKGVGQWTVAATTGDKLLVGPMDGALAEYSLATHGWTQIPLPPGCALPLRRLALTAQHRWLLDGKGNLYAQPAQPNAAWTPDPVAQGIERDNDLSCDGDTVCFLQRGSGCVGGVEPRKALRAGAVVGNPIEGAGAVTTATGFQGDIFVAAGGRVARYAIAGHDWATFPANQVSGVVQFAHTQQFLYARSADGQVRRFPAAAGGAQWEAVTGGRPALEAADMAGAGDTEVYLKLKDGEVVSIADNANGQAQTQVAATRLGAQVKGNVAAAIEHGPSLIVGTDGQGVWAYQADPQGVRRWAQAASGHAPAAAWAVTGLLAPSGPNDTWLGVVTPDGVQVLSLQKGQWDYARTAFQGIGGLEARRAGPDLYATYEPAKGQGRRLEREPIAGNGRTVLVGDRLPAPVGDTRAVAILPGGDMVFRADRDGPVGRYARPQGSWAAEQGLSHVRSFPESLQRLWAWSPRNKSLHRYDAAAGKWLAEGMDDGKVAQVAWDADGLLLRDADGAIHYRTAVGQPDELVLPAPRPIFKAAPDKFTAVAEFDGRLFVAVPGEPLQEYSLGAHAWKAHPDLADVVDLAFAAKSPLFALTKAGQVHQMPPGGNGFAAVAVPDQRLVAQLAVAGGTVVGRCRNGDVVGLFPGAAPTMLLAQGGVPGKGPFEVTAAAEAVGKLFLGLHSAGGEHLAVFDPATLKWSSVPATGEVRRILCVQNPKNPKQSDVWICEGKAGDKAMRLRRVGLGAAEPTLGDPLEPILDVAEHKGDVFVITEKNYLRQLNPAGNGLDPVDGIGDRALPEDPKAPGARPAVTTRFADEGILAVLLENGALFHYDVEKTGWYDATPNPKAERKVTPQLIVVSDVKNHCAFLAADGQFYEYEREKKAWTPIMRKDPEGRTILENPKATAPARRMWDIGRDAKGPTYKASVRDGGEQFELEFNRNNDGRLDFDRFVAVAADGDAIWLKAEKERGVWEFSRKEKDGDLARRRFVANPRAGLFDEGKLEFTGQEFALTRGDGHWTLRGGKDRAYLRWNRLGADDGSRSTKPHERNPEGLGFAQLNASDLAAAGGQLYARTPGGDTVAFTIKDGTLSLDGRVTAQNQAQADAAFKAAASLERYNPLLEHWAVKQEGGDGKAQLCLKLAGKEPKSVSFTQSGFGFDQAVAMELAPNALVFYTVDGKAELERKGQDHVLKDLATEFAKPDIAAPAEIAREGDAALYLYREDDKGDVADARRHAGQAWPKAAAAEVARVLEQLRRTLVTAHGWKWMSDDKVVLNLRALNGGRETKVAFDREAGRFTHDVVLAIEASGAELHALTAAGLAMYGQGGISELRPPASDKLAADAMLWVGPKDKRLFARLAPQEVLERVQGKWGNASQDQAAASLKDRQEWMLWGEPWRVSRANPLDMWTPLVPQAKDFHKVTIKPGEAFDFEDVRDLQSLPGELHLATRFGLVSIDSTNHQPTDVRPAQGLGDDSMARDQGTVFARILPGEVLQRKAQAGAWQPGASEAAFARAQSVLFDDALWSVELRAQAVTFLFRYHGAEKKEEVQIAQGRFAFDRVSGLVHQGASAWFIGPLGLIRRDLTDPKIVERLNLPVEEATSSFCRLTLQREPECFLRTARTTYRLKDNAWQPVGEQEARDVESLAKLQVARGPMWNAERGDRGGVLVALALGADPYKPVKFSAAEGKFTFDVLNDVCADRPGEGGDDAQLRILVATDGGVASYDLNPQMTKLFCLLSHDGIGPEPVDRIVDGHGRTVLGLPNVRILARVPGKPAHYRLEGQRWVPLERDAAAVFRQVEDLLTCDEKGWTARVSRDADRPVALEWKFTPVYIVPSGQPNTWRFAHDMLRFAARSADTLWLATRGGVVAYPLAAGEGGASEPDLMSPTVYRDGFVSDAEIAAAQKPGAKDPPKGSSVLYHDDGAKALLARAAASKSLFRIADGQATAATEADAARFRELATVLSSAFWTWRKEGEEPVAITFAKPDVPENYQRIIEGKLHFARVEYLPARKPHEATMAAYRGSLYAATRGGVVKCAADASDIQRLYAQCHSRPADAPKAEPMLDVSALHHDPAADKLYARTQGGTVAELDPEADRWTVAALDPFAGERVIDKDQLLEWRRLADGRLALAFSKDDKGESRSDLKDPATYPFFTDGRFSFDPVTAFDVAGERLWLAGPGGIRDAGMEPGAPDYVFIDAFRRPEAVAARSLPEATEVVAPTTNGAAEVLARTAAGAPYRLADGKFTAVTDQDRAAVDAAFEQAYTKVPSDSAKMRWVQPPNGLYATVESLPGPLLTLGGRGADAPLFSRGRISLDDVRDACLTAEHLILTTAGGVCQYTLDRAKESVGGRLIYGHAVDAQGRRAPLAGLERIEASEGGFVAWDERRLCLAKPAERPGTFRWQPAPPGTPNPTQRRVLADKLGVWTIEHGKPATPGGATQITFAERGTRAVSSHKLSEFPIADLSTATQTQDYLWLPMKQGLVWVHKKVFRETIPSNP